MIFVGVQWRGATVGGYTASLPMRGVVVVRQDLLRATMSRSDICSGCSKPEPSEYCWDGRDLDCPMGHPPRWATNDAAVMNLWRLVKDMQTRDAGL